MHETVPANRRVYMVMQPGSGGMMQMRLSLTPPKLNDPTAVFLLRGVLPLGNDITLNLVSDPTQDDALRGLAGKDGTDGASAYQIARAAGYGGTLTQWLASLRATDGKNGADGKSAAALLGTVTIGQTATVALTAGIRRVVITVPASFGLGAGDPIILVPAKALDGYAIHDAVAVTSTTINVGISAPVLAIGASFSIATKLFRLNT
ncbi:hypothetical protein [Sphingomonas sp. Leaf38]|uniref:hypothetical protein n=1 Tax=Sphingomonas sp. Leaf38 TaxID=1736217 RepID=UPI000700EBBB|nr:hypothetical protein [Sphingomonas sp. Leaf38]KQN33625.1 hypothetical protein ASE88_00910 [Sphingomonas sp. Leaf38]